LVITTSCQFIGGTSRRSTPVVLMGTTALTLWYHAGPVKGLLLDYQPGGFG
jgi:hypothetical protein